MTAYSICNSAGKIIKSVEAASDEIAGWQVGAGETLITQLLDPNTQYIVDPGGANTVTTRPLLSTVASWDVTTIAADGEAMATLSGLPNPSSYQITVPTGVTVVPSGIITTSSLSFKADYPGPYTVTIDSFPYQPYSQVITTT